MRNQRISIKKKIIVSLFFVIIGGIIFNSTFFLHTHRNACGKVIVHAHPFNKEAEKENPLSQHSHNKIDLQVISSLQYFIDFDLVTEIKHYFIKIDVIAVPSTNGIVCHISSLIQKRGPPSTTTFV